MTGGLSPSTEDYLLPELQNDMTIDTDNSLPVTGSGDESSHCNAVADVGSMESQWYIEPPDRNTRIRLYTLDRKGEKWYLRADFLERTVDLVCEDYVDSIANVRKRVAKKFSNTWYTCTHYKSLHTKWWCHCEHTCIMKSIVFLFSTVERTLTLFSWARIEIWSCTYIKHFLNFVRCQIYVACVYCLFKGAIILRQVLYSWFFTEVSSEHNHTITNPYIIQS